MKKLLVLALSAILVLSMVTVAMAAVTTSGILRFEYKVPNPGTNVNQSQLRLNFDNEVNKSVVIHAQLRAYSGDDNKPYLHEYSATLNQSFGTFKIGQWANDFFGDVDVLGEFTDSLWASPWSIQFSPKLSEGFSAAIWYNPGNTDATVLPLKNYGNYAIGSGAYTVSGAYTADALSVEAAYGDIGKIAGTTYDSVIILNASYKLDIYKFFLHYANQGKKNPYTNGTELKNQIIGANIALPDTGFSAQLEYDLAPDNDKPIGLGLYYSANDLDYVFYHTVAGSNTTEQFRLQINF